MWSLGVVVANDPLGIRGYVAPQPTEVMMSGTEFFLLLALIPAYAIAIYAANKKEPPSYGGFNSWREHQLDRAWRMTQKEYAEKFNTDTRLRAHSNRIEALEKQLAVPETPEPNLASRLAALEARARK